MGWKAMIFQLSRFCMLAPGALFYWHLLTPAFTLATSVVGVDTSLSPAADVICHTNDPSGCYPRVFQPTDKFETVRDDQELPVGLHVRLNVWTGEKEAKLDVPSDLDSSLGGPPTDSSVLVLGPEQVEVTYVLHGAPAYDLVGKIKAPQDDSRSFYDALAALKWGWRMSDDELLDAALEILRELAHDIYYGLRITEDLETIRTLLCMMGKTDVLRDEDTAHLAQVCTAASIISAALQNNQAALRGVEKVWSSLSQTMCPGSRDTLDRALFGVLLPDDGIEREKLSLGEGAIALIKAKVSALNGLIKSPLIRMDFLENGAMAQILQFLVMDMAETEAAKRKLANLVMDNFLDAGMGAILGEWPRNQTSGDDACHLDTVGANESCWEYHLRRLAREYSDYPEHWSQDLWEALQRQKRLREQDTHVRSDDF